ncbi:GspH/FimT family pseudopilin [Dyella acidiphila]|uniref:Type II secretion system protein H n=1 Tax=Dyella acidiphila TaxID=2775866 RepID=A0ABR9G7R3_9GAMM|nr:GspH/FimT family pseudopilin [Dyella acidiphila]MBE1160070.1 GspH/FimT family pseudopilin [Dyella acidiphila]
MNTMRKHRRATAGFTVIEMLVVLVIAAIVMAYAIPSYKTMVTNYRLTGELNDLQTDVELARSTAVREGATVTMCPSANPTASAPTCQSATTTQWNTGWIIFTDTSTTTNSQQYTVANGDVLVRVHGPLQNNDSLLSSSSDTGTTVSSLTFNRMGGATSLGGSATTPPTGSLVLNDAAGDAGMIRCIQIGLSGTISVYSPQAGGTSTCP